MKKRSLISLLIVVCMLAALLSGCGGSADKSAQTVELKLATHDPSNSANTLTIQSLVDKTTEATDGRVKITIHSDAVLGPAVDGLTMLDTGVCDMLWTTTSFFADQFPMCELTTMPMLGADDVFDLTAAFWDMYETHPEWFEKEFEGIKPLILSAGGQGVIATTEPLDSIDDLNGMTMRVVTGPLSTFAQNVGVNAVSMGPNDIFLSMEKGVINGYMFNCDGLRNFSLFDVTNYAYCFGSSTMDASILVFMSDSAWDKISEEDQKIIMEIWGREGSKAQANSLYESALTCQEQLGDKFVQITEGEFYEDMKAEVATATQVYLDRDVFAGLPMHEAYDFLLERLEAYRG